MGISIQQAYLYPPVTTNDASLVFVGICTPDPATGALPAQSDVLAAFQTSPAIPTIFQGFPWTDTELAHIVDTIWTYTVKYKRQRAPELIPESAGPVLDFDTSGGTQHIVVSQGTVTTYPSGAADPQNAIAEGKGIDIGVAAYRWTEEWQLLDPTYSGPPPALTDNVVEINCNSAYRAILAGLTYQVNQGNWRGFAIGSVLFEGASGRRVKGGLYAVSYKFAYSANTPSGGIAIGPPNGALTGIVKTGWQYMDVICRDQTFGSATPPLVLGVPVQVNIHTVYQPGDFDMLDIPWSPP